MTLMGTPPPILQANLSMADSLILMVLALVVFGPRRLPQIGRQIGKLMYEFRKASNDFKFQMEEEFRATEEADRRKREEAERQRTLALNPPSASEAQPLVAEAATPPAASDSEMHPPSGEGKTDDSALNQTAPETAPEQEGSLRILPPSTGETVAASRPITRTADKTGADPAADSAKPDQQERDAAAAEESDAVAEQATRNG
jgi:sec-independent protein translocase protein TatB